MSDHWPDETTGSKAARENRVRMQNERRKAHCASIAAEDAVLLKTVDVKALASATGSVARWWSGVPMTNADVWEFALGEGWKPGLGDDAKSAVAFLTKNGHKFQEITPPNDGAMPRRQTENDHEQH